MHLGYGQMNLIKKSKMFAFIMLAFLMLATSCAGTQDGNENVIDKNEVLPEVSSGVVADNNQFQLLWDNGSGNIFLVDKASRKIWSTIPYEYYTSDRFANNPSNLLNSSLNLLYIEPENQQQKAVNSFVGVIENGRKKSEKIDNGIKVTYFFDNVDIAVPVEYIINSKGLEASIIVKGIIEGKNKIVQIDLLPYFAAAPNDTDSYLFIPSGSGMIMNVDSTKRPQREFFDQVYGTDPSITTDFKPLSLQPIRLPVFGVKNKDDAMIGIISKGAESANISAKAGNPATGYSQVNASFRFRGLDTVKIPDLWGTKVAMSKYTDDIVNIDKFVVDYYTVNHESNDYSGMAATYRNYLTDKEGLKKKGDGPPLCIELFGGASLRKFFLGIPYDTLNSITTFKQAKYIVENIIKDTKIIPLVKLTGFTKGGLEKSNVAGGFGFDRKMGGMKGYKEFYEFCMGSDIESFVDFDLVNYRKSGNGFNTLLDSAKTASSAIAYQYYYSVATKDILRDKSRYYLLARDKLISAGEKLKSFAGRYDIHGFSITSLGSIAYSDYSSPDYYLKNNMGSDAAKIIGEISKNETDIMAGDANLYAAVKAGHIVSAPANAGYYDVADDEVPFYQMVFKGMTPVSNFSVNLSMDPSRQFLKSIETGSGLMFSLCYSDTAKFSTSTHSALLASVYKDNITMINDMAGQSKEYFEAVKNALIKSHKKLSDGVYETQFDNGLQVVVNYTGSKVQTGIGEVSPHSFIYKK